MDVKEFSPWVLKLKGTFEKSGQTLGFTESCTGGLLAAAVVAEPGVSSFFKGAVVSYAGAVKESLLGVPASVLVQEGEVSLPTVQAMARGGAKALGVDWCVAVSGVAGPEGGSAEKPVGTVCFAVFGPGFEEQRRQFFSSAGETLTGNARREDIQRQSVIFAFDFLLSAVR